MKPTTGILTINLSAIQANWRHVTHQLNAGASASAVIKANAYGLGASYVGPALYQVGCREFFLATFEEALAARQNLPADAQIYVLGGARPGAEFQFVQHRLIPVLLSLSDLYRWRGICDTLKMRIPCAIKINTGMTRLGLDVGEWLSVLTSSDMLTELSPQLVMSHLACADEHSHPLNREQLARFRHIVDSSRPVLPHTRFSLANSSGIFLGSEWHFDMVRPGAALYGINPRVSDPSPMQSVVHLELPILQTRRLNHQVSVGYGAVSTGCADTTLAVAAGGYADGLHRTIGREQGAGMIGNFKVPVVGRISMDTTIFDITSVPTVEFSDESPMIQVLNDELTVDLMMAKTGALGYEILTSLGNRYQRRYVHDVKVIHREPSYD